MFVCARILCPNVEVMLQWHGEIRRFASHLKVLFYHGDDDAGTLEKQGICCPVLKLALHADYRPGPEVMQRYDVVVSTAEII